MSPPEDEEEMLAAEAALGLLAPDEQAAALARIGRDPAFAARHRYWQQRAAALFPAGSEAPSPAVWERILARLPANDAGDPARLAGRLRWWRTAGLGSAAAAILLGGLDVGLWLSRPAPTPAPVRIAAQTARAPWVAVLSSPDRSAVVTISYDPANRTLVSAPARLTLPGHDPELWIVPAGKTPIPLGVFAAGRPSVRLAPGAAAALMAPGSTLAVSVEPVGGSPTGLPTGPVILTGTIVSA